MLEVNKIYLGDCLDVMKSIDDKSIDMILCDLPYGISQCQWDSIIPFDKLWKNYNRLINDRGAIILSSTQPFTSVLIMSNAEMFKYVWVWQKDKSKCVNFVHAKNSPLRATEDICVFSKGSIAHQSNPNRMNYNPQGLIPYGKTVKGNGKDSAGDDHHVARPSHKEHYIREFTNYPVNIISFNTDFRKQLHPTQKPVALFEYLIKTYTNENDLVLDNCIGSGTTAIACINTNRRYIGIEKEEKYFNIAQERVKNHLNSMPLNLGLKT